MRAARRRTWELLEPGRTRDRASRAVDVFILGLIVVNVAAVIVGSVAAVAARAGVVLAAIEAVSVAVFSAEYLLRLWSAREDPRYRGAVAGRLRGRSPRWRWWTSRPCSPSSSPRWGWTSASSARCG